MKYGRLGTSGLMVSKLSFGGGSLGVGETLPGLNKNIDQKTADRIVAIAIERGINLFDSADKYVGGASEEVLGQALGARRKDVVIGTKCGGRVGSLPTDAGLSARHIIKSCETSLKKLRTDWIDVFYAHTHDPNTPLEETARAFDHLVRSGMVRYVAVSNWPAWMAAVFLERQKASGYAPIICNQVYYSLVGRDIERDLVPLGDMTGLGIISYSSLAGGFLTGKYERDKPPPIGTRRATFTLSPKLDLDAAFRVVDALKELSSRYNTCPGNVALAWTMRQSFISSVTFGVSQVSQLEQNLAAADLTIDDTDFAALDRMTSIAE